MTTAVLFDLDRTLIQYEPALPGIFRDALAELGLTPAADRFEHFRDRFLVHFAGFEGDPFVSAATDHAREYDLPVGGERLAEAFLDAERDAARVHPGVRSGLDALADHPLGVVTNGYGPVQRRKLAATGIDHYFATVVTPDSVGAFKPDHAMFEAAVERVPADAYAVVGDSVEADVLPANELGFRSVLYGDADDRADACVSDPGDFGRIADLL
jgi:putative hydrolase of the HAD superfamily